MASLVDQIFMQAQAGSANGASFFDAFQSGQEMRLKRDQLNAELAMMPLRQTLLEQQSAHAAAQTQDLLAKNKLRNLQQQGLADLNTGLAARVEQGATADDTFGYLMDFGNTHPIVAGSDEYKQLVKQTLEAKQISSIDKYRA